MKELVKSIARTKWVDGLNPWTLTTYIYSDGSTNHRWETPHSISCGFGGLEYLIKLHCVRTIKTSLGCHEEYYQIVLTKFKNGKPIKKIAM